MNARSLRSMGLFLVVALGVGCTTDAGGTGGAAGTLAGTTGTPMAGMPGTGGIAGMTAGMTGTAGIAGTTAGVTGTGGIAGTTAGMTGTGGTAGMGTGGMGAGGMAGMGTGGMGTGGMAGMNGTGGTTPDATQTCIDNAAEEGRTGACVECGCTKCLAAIDNCADDACKSVVTCGQAAGCKGRACYCGELDAITCAFGAGGPCMMEIATAAGVCGTAPATCASMLSNVTSPSSAMYDANNPVSRANQLSVCTRGQLADPGVPPLVPAAEAIAGMCETECM